LQFGYVKLSGIVDILSFDSFWSSQIWLSGYHFSHTCTLRKTSNTCTGVHTSYGRGGNVKWVSADEDN